MYAAAFPPVAGPWSRPVHLAGGAGRPGQGNLPDGQGAAAAEEAELVARVAALDIGKATLTACVRVPHEDKPGRRRQEVRTFATVTRSLLELRDWLICQGVSLCVMEATSTYWKPPFYLLEDAIDCWVVNAGM